MALKNMIRRTWCRVVVIILSTIVLGQSMNAQQHAIRKDIQDAIRNAEVLAQEGQYADALRLLFDAMYRETHAQLNGAVYSEDQDAYEEFPITAGQAITKVERLLLYEDQSPLMQYFRDPNVPIDQKQTYIQELRMMVWQGKHESEEVVLGGTTYHGTFIQLLMSRKLSEGEKIDVLYWIERIIQEEYTSKAQRQSIREEIARLQNMAEQKLQEHQYVEAFSFLTEATAKVQTLPNLLSREESRDLHKQRVRMVEVFLELDESPLMQLFKSQQIPSRIKRQALSELRTVSSGKFLFYGEEYTGSIVQIFSNPKIDSSLQLLILGKIETMIEQ